MTPAHKALEGCRLAWKECLISSEEYSMIETALQRAEKANEAFELTKRLWLKQTEENIFLKDKTQGLVKALEDLRRQFSIGGNMSIKTVDEALSAFGVE